MSKGPTSFWRPYLETLPRSYTTLCCFSPSDIAALQVAHAIEVADSAADALQLSWQTVQPTLADLGD